jgi:hypothetical protein
VIDLEAIWQELDDDPAASPGLVLRRADLASFHVYLAQERPSRSPAFLVRIKDDPGSLWKDFRPSLGLDVRVEARPDQEPSLLMVERDARFHEIFSALVADLLKGLQDVATLPTDERPLTLDFLIGRITRWQACLQANRDGLSGEKAAGLFGELSTLARLLQSGVDPVLAVTRWTGPSNAIQDFQFAHLALEIKASRQTQPTNVRISSERQLDTTDNQRLLLIHYGLDERSDSSGSSLPQKVADLRSMLGEGHAVMLFDDRLAEYGYLDMHAARYADRSYTIRQVDHFDVRHPMPRITEDDLPVGVGRVSYDLALAGCEPFRVGEAEVDSLFATVLK